MEANNDLTNIYTECSNSYHKVDDFRAKLLGFLPLASGIGIFGALYNITSQEDKSTLSDNHVALGIFGMMVNFGLLIYELKGIVKCMHFINLGKWIESQLQGNDKRGFFTELSKGSKLVNEPVASAIIYSTVMAGWVYVIFLKWDVLKCMLPTLVFVLMVAFVYSYWWYQSGKIGKKIKKYPDLKKVLEESSTIENKS